MPGTLPSLFLPLLFLILAVVGVASDMAFGFVDCGMRIRIPRFFFLTRNVLVLVEKLKLANIKMYAMKVVVLFSVILPTMIDQCVAQQDNKQVKIVLNSNWANTPLVLEAR